MKASIAARFEHHRERKERKIHKDVGIPYSDEAISMLRPWEDALLNSTKEFMAYGKPCTAKTVYNKIVGDALALTASEKASDSLIPASVNEIDGDVARCIISLLEREGITL